MTIDTPDWVKDAVFYQIFPDSFCRLVPPHQAWLLEPPGCGPLQPWDDPPTGHHYKGGTLWGIASQLDALQDLGITALYLTPIFQSGSNHRYHTHDYYQVDPLLGGNEALEHLRDALHQRGMALVLDGVFNHGGRGFFPFHDLLEQGPQSPWLDWFEVEGWPLAAYDGNLPAHYRSWDHNRALPQFNHRNPAVREYLMRVGEYWIRQGIDGWRLDVPFCITVPGFWQEFRQRIKAINPQAYITGEIFGDATPWLDGSQFDGVMNYAFGEATLGFVGGDRLQRQHLPNQGYCPPALDAGAYGQAIVHLLQRYPWDIQLTQLNLLGSHDVARLATVLDNDRPSLLLALVLLFTFPGAPCVYYGDEVGLEGGHDPDCRRGFPPRDLWDETLRHQWRELIHLRHQSAVLRRGTYTLMEATGQRYAFRRNLGDQGAIVVLNAEPQPQTFHLELGDAAPWSVAYGREGIDQGPLSVPGESEAISFTLKPRSACIWLNSP